MILMSRSRPLLSNLFREYKCHQISWMPFGKTFSLQQKCHIHTTVLRKKKIFVDNENVYAHNIMKENMNIYNVYNPTIANNLLPKSSAANFESIDWNTLPAEDILKSFRQIVQYCHNTNTCISNEQFDLFVDAFAEKCLKFTDDQLIDAMKILIDLPETERVNTRNFLELWNALDTATTNRITDWDLKQILYVFDLWYHLKLGRVNKFSSPASKKIGRKIRRLTPQQLVQMMFYCNVMRTPLYEMVDFEIQVAKNLQYMNLNEISIICMGFFKTQTKLKSEQLIQNIIGRLSKESSTIPDIGLVNILKVLRYSAKPHHRDALNELIEKLTPEIPRVSLLTCLHIALIGSDIQLCHQKSTELIVERFLKELKTTRIKDMERIAFMIGFMNFETSSRIEDELCENILIELKERVDEITRFPRCFTNCLHYLTFKEYYSDEFLTSILDEKFLKYTYGDNVFVGREIFALDSYARINLHSSYNGNLLNLQRRQIMGKNLSHYVPNRTGKYRLSVTDRLLLEISETVAELYKFCKLAHVLPHYERPDGILAYNKQTKQAVDVSDHFPMLYSGEILSKSRLLKDEPMAADIELVNFIVGGWNYFERSTEKPTGPLQLKIKQSSLIGFNPIMIPYYDWSKLTPEERKIYIQHRLTSEFFNKI